MTADWVGALAESPVALLALYAATTVDGVLPPVPSESAVVGLAALSTSGVGPALGVIGAVAALGAFTGDQLAYSLGRRLDGRGSRLVRSRRARATLDWAQDALARRGAAVILGARFTPGGRVLVNVAAGAVGYPRARFTVLAAVGAVAWAGCSVLVGVGAGRLLAEHHPALGVVAGVVAGVLVGAVVDRVLRLRVPRRRRSAVPVPAVPAGAECCDGVLVTAGRD